MTKNRSAMLNTKLTPNNETLEPSQIVPAYVGVECATLRDVHEPYLERSGLTERIERGRIATERARELYGAHYREAKVRRVDLRSPRKRAEVAEAKGNPCSAIEVWFLVPHRFHGEWNYLARSLIAFAAHPASRAFQGQGGREGAATAGSRRPRCERAFAIGAN